MTRAADVIMPRITELMTQIQEDETQRMEKEIQATVKTTDKPAKPAGRTPRTRPKH